MTMRAAAMIGLLVALAAPRGAGANEPWAAADLALRHHDVRANFGAFSAVGFAGFTYGYAPIREVQLEAGVGYGIAGLQLSAMPKLSVGSESHRLVLGLGASTGIDAGGLVSYWLTADAGYEYRGRSGFSFLVAAGLTHALGGRMRDRCLVACAETAGEPAAGASVRGLTFPQLRVAVGQWF